MSDVNLNVPGLKLVHSSQQAAVRATASPQVEGLELSAQKARASSVPAGITSLGLNSSTGEAAKAGGQRDIDGEGLERAVAQLNDFVQSVQRDLQFEVNQELGTTIVKVVDQETQKVIRQIPDDVAIRLAENLLQDEPLALFDLKV